MRTVNPGDAYDKDNFVNAMGDLEGLEGLLSMASREEGLWNPNVRKSLGDLIRDDKKFYAGLTPDQVQNDAREALLDHSEKIAEYCKGKLTDLLGKVKTENLPDLLYSLSLAKTEDPDEIVDAINEKKAIEKAIRERTTDEYVDEKLKQAADWRKEAYSKYSAYNQDYTQRTFNAYARDAEYQFMKVMMNEEGKIDRGKLVNFVKENYNKIVAKTKFDSKEANAFRLMVAKVAYQSEKK